MMKIIKNYYPLLFLCLTCLLSVSCHEKEELEYSRMNIERNFPYSMIEREIDNPVSMSHFLKDTIFAINSVEELSTHPLMEHCPDFLQEEYGECDFQKYTLVLTHIGFLRGFTDLDCSFLRRVDATEYICTLNISYKSGSDSEKDKLYCLTTSHLVKKNPEESKLVFRHN